MGGERGLNCNQIESNYVINVCLQAKGLVPIPEIVSIPRQIEVEVAALEAIATLGEAATAAQQLLISNGALLTSVASTAFSRSSVNASLRCT